MTADLSDFITTLYPPDCVEEESIKIASDLESLPFEELLALAGLDSTSEQEKRAYMIAEKVGMYGDEDSSWLEQFAGSPLHQQAIQICEKDLEMRTQHLQKRMARDKEVDHSSEWNEREQLGLEKKRLELALHKQKATEGQPEAQPGVPTGPAPSALAATPAGQVPTPPTTATPKVPTAPAPAAPQTASSPAAGAGGTKTSAKRVVRNEHGIPLSKEWQGMSDKQRNAPVYGTLGGMLVGGGVGGGMAGAAAHNAARGNKGRAALLGAGALTAAVGGPLAGREIGMLAGGKGTRAGHKAQLAYEKKMRAKHKSKSKSKKSSVEIMKIAILRGKA